MNILEIIRTTPALTDEERRTRLRGTSGSHQVEAIMDLILHRWMEAQENTTAEPSALPSRDFDAGRSAALEAILTDLQNHLTGQPG